MTARDRINALAFSSHRPRRTIRLRLTAIYGGLFLLCGAGLLAITYALVDHATPNYFSTTGPGGARSIIATTHGKGSSAGSRPSLHSSGGQPPLTPKQTAAQAHQLQVLGANQHANELHQLLVYSGVALAIMAVLSVALGWLIAGRVLRPLRTITTTVRQISATNLNRRLALSGPEDELKELGDTFDDLLDRLENFIAAQRQFVANASHELRTPLAWQRTLVQVALDDPGATLESLRAAHERVLASGAQQERLIEALLTLTRGQTGPERREPLDLAEIVDQIVLGRQVRANQGALDIHTTLEPAQTTGDPRLVERLVINLVDNALRYNVENGRVDITTATQDGRAILSVANAGPMVPSEAVNQLVQPFRRLGSERVNHDGGLGLGLSIVNAIVAAHRAELDIRAGLTGGLIVEIRFPSGGDGDVIAGTEQVHAKVPLVDGTRIARNESNTVLG
jgi:signal transduction histidine kinase